MIHYHDVLKAAMAGEPYIKLVEIAGGQAELSAIRNHVRERVDILAHKDRVSPVWVFKYAKALNYAMKELRAIEKAYETREQSNSA